MYTADVSRSAARSLLILAALAAAAGLQGASGVVAEADRSVRVKAVVTDAKGQPVAGLKAADFTLLVDGTPQAIDSVEYVGGARREGRTIAFLLDEFHTAAEHSAAVREALLRFVDRGLRPGDLALVVKPLDPLTSVAPTADRAAVREAIAAFEGRKGDYTPRTPFERSYMAQAPNAVASARAQIVTAALRVIGSTLSRHPSASQAIVLVGDGFARVRSSREVPARLQAAIRIANQADAAVYAFAPSLSAPPAGGPEEPDPSYAALAALTGGTGGALVTGVTGLDAGLARMQRDLDAHYVVAYRAGHGRDGRFHSVRIATTREGLQVRAREGYVAPGPETVRASTTTAQAGPLRVLRRSPLIRSWAGMVPAGPERAQVTMTWEPAEPRPGAPARGRAASVVITASTPEGTTLFDAAVSPVGSGGDPQYARFEAPVGPVRIDMKVLDAKGVVIDTDARDVVVPAPRDKGPTMYPPAVLRTQSAREFREVSADPNATPVPAREFRRTERLLLRVAALGESGEAAPVTAVLLNRLRQPIRELPAMAGSTAEGVTQFDLPLASLAPGDYSVRLSVAGSTGGLSEYVTFRVGG